MYLFFVREFNDIDHITPIVWKMARDNHEVAVLCLNPGYDINRDYRLRFLKDQNIPVNFIFDQCGEVLGWKHALMRYVSKACFAAANALDGDRQSLFSPLRKDFRRRMQKFGRRLYKRCKREFYNTNWAQRLINKLNVQALCFDHVSPQRYLVKTLLDAADEKRVPVIALPHGVYIYTNNLVRTGSNEEDRFDKFNRFDYIVTQNPLRKKVLANAGIDNEKIYVLGSARYCDEWMTQNRSILPRSMKTSRTTSQELKAVFMTTRFAYKIDVDRMLETLEILSQMEGIDVVVKPHTRSGKEAKVYDEVPLRNVHDVSSVELCEWADVMLVIGSSILIETLVQQKPVLYLKYLHKNTTEYEELGACWTIHDEAELKNALVSLQNHRTKVPYTDEDVDRFLSRIIYGGRSKRDVLGDYEDFIVLHSQKK